MRVSWSLHKHFIVGERHGEGGRPVYRDARHQHLRGGQPDPGLRQGGYREGRPGADGVAGHLGHPAGQAEEIRGRFHPGRLPPLQAQPSAAHRAELCPTAAASRV